MRNRILILAAALITGCAAQQPTMPVVTTPPPVEMASAALAFDAPITLDQPAINLSRSDRGPAAFVGFEEVSVSSYDVFTDNRNSGRQGDWYIRDSFTEQSGITRR